ncbi:MAG: hypothetical protein U0992_23080 [Planctomycetaceae bacterium]
MSNAEPTPVPSVPDPNQPLVRELETQFAALQRGANWFYWIAGLSLVNSVTPSPAGRGVSSSGWASRRIDAIANTAAAISMGPQPPS